MTPTDPTPYTPTDEMVREAYRHYQAQAGVPGEYEAEYDRWLAARDARVRAEAVEVSTLPEKFRDPYILARFVIENEWALDSKINPSGRADWRETLGRVYDAWDGETPEDIVAAIAAAIRLDRSFRAASIEQETQPRASCGCDLTGMTPPAVHIVDRHGETQP